MRNAGLEEAQAGIKIAGRNNITSDMQMTPTLRKRSRKQRTKESLDESEKGEWKSWLKIQKTKIMASGSITSWQIDGETMETVSDFMFLGSQITADGDCSHEIKKTLTPWKESFDQPR